MTADELARVTAERDAARDEVTRLDAELTGVRASLVEQAEDAEDARAVVAMRDGRLREAQAERDAALAVVTLAAALVREYDAACPDWWPDAMGPLRDALCEAGSTRGGSASPEDPVAGRVGASEGFSSPWIANAVKAAILPIKLPGRVTFTCDCSGIHRESVGFREWTYVYLPCEAHREEAMK